MQPSWLLSSGVRDALYFLRLFPPSLKGCILSAVDKNSGRTAIHIHREKQYARQNVCIALFYRFYNILRNCLSALIYNKRPRQAGFPPCLVPFYRLFLVSSSPWCFYVLEPPLLPDSPICQKPGKPAYDPIPLIVSPGIIPDQPSIEVLSVAVSIAITKLIQ